MGRPHGLLRAGYPYLRTLGMRRVIGYAADISWLGDDAYILMRSEGAASVRIWPFEDAESLSDDLKGFGTFGSDEGQMMWPVQIIKDGDDHFYISDEATHRITKFNSEGEFQSMFGVQGDSDGEFDGPTGISFDTEGNLVVVDSRNHRVQRYTTSGEYLGGFGSHGDGPGQFDLPWGVHVDELGDIYVSDWGNNRFQVFDSGGEVKNVVGKRGSGDAEFERPAGIAVDAHGDIYVADWGNNRVQMFNSEGHYLLSFRGDASLSRVARHYMLTNAVSNRLREMGKIETEKYLRRPRSVRIDDQFRLMIPDYEGYRVQIYQKDVIELDRTQFAAPLRNPTLEVT